MLGPGECSSLHRLFCRNWWPELRRRSSQVQLKKINSPGITNTWGWSIFFLPFSPFHCCSFYMYLFSIKKLSLQNQGSELGHGCKGFCVKWFWYGSCSLSSRALSLVIVFSCGSKYSAEYATLKIVPSCALFPRCCCWHWGWGHCQPLVPAHWLGQWEGHRICLVQMTGLQEEEAVAGIASWWKLFLERRSFLKSWMVILSACQQYQIRWP